MFAIVDSHNFYVSCERIFRPDLANTPIVVLSNNDGAVVARSPEVKAMGIKMGEPWFKLKQRGLDQYILPFSSNYALYGDISNRVVSIIGSQFADYEVYSVDESFISMPGFGGNLDEVCRKLKFEIKNATGIDSGIGCGQTKTLAKLANYASKKYPATGGVVVLDDPARIQKLRSITPVAEVWGVGRKLTGKLMAEGINTADDLARANPSVIRARYGVVLERTLRELNGISCLPLELVQEQRKQIVRSRSFGMPVTSFRELKAAVITHAISISETLSREGLVAGGIQVFISSSPFRGSYYRRTEVHSFVTPTKSISELYSAAVRLLKLIWKGDVCYKKAGVMAFDITSTKNVQGDLFSTSVQEQKLDSAIYEVEKIIPGGVFIGSTLGHTEWKMKREMLSPRYTSDWKDLPRVY